MTTGSNQQRDTSRANAGHWETGQTHGINLTWLMRLRWGAIVGQAALILGVHFGMEIALPLGLLFSVVLVETLTNLGCAVWARSAKSVPEWLMLALLMLDVVLLTALLWLTGGTFNPFNFLYLVHIVLAAVILRPLWTWALVVLATASFGLLFVVPSLGGGGGHAHHGAGHDPGPMDLHLRGMWVAFAVAAFFIVYFVQRIRRELRAREEQLAAERLRRMRTEQLASLATLAAGAAHELSTPLSTIALIAGEMEVPEEDAAATQADARLIRLEVERCRAILNRLASDAGSTRGEVAEPISARRLVELALEGLAEREQLDLQLPDSVADSQLCVPRGAFANALRVLVDNAFEASPADARVVLALRSEGGGCVFEVADRGEGMTEDIVQRAIEPFFTTKPPGKGMGLGLFLALSVAESLGGTLQLESEAGVGTRAALWIPQAADPGHVTIRRIAEGDRSVHKQLRESAVPSAASIAAAHHGSSS